jgi:hypothetical protein
VTTYEEIVVNRNWFKHQIEALEERAGECSQASGAVLCTFASGWTAPLEEFRVAYEELLHEMSGETDMGYLTGRNRLEAAAELLEATLRAYIRAEADAEAAIRSQVLDLLDEI